MATLADSFLDDLDELEGGSDDETEATSGGVVQAADADGDAEMEDAEDLGRGDAADAGVDAEAAASAASGALLPPPPPRPSRKSRGLTRSARFQEQMKAIREAQWDESKAEAGGEEMIITCNQLIADVDEELLAVHRNIIEAYAPKFPELESLVPQPLDYVRTLRVIGNETDMTKVDLDSVLPQTTVMVVSVTASTTNGKPLEEAALTDVLRACDEYEELCRAKADVLGFLEGRMATAAPNLSALVGSRIAAQLVGLAGSLPALARVPACNMVVLGQEKYNRGSSLAGFSSLAAMRHTGIIHHSELVQSAPPYLRSRALKVTAAKAALAARCDAYGTTGGGGEEDAANGSAQGDGVVAMDSSNGFGGSASTSRAPGAKGRQFRAEVEEKIGKWQEPQQSKTKKALPKPDEAPKKKRGGKRIRKFKDKFAVTEVRKEANRMGFASMSDEYGDSAMGRDFGMLGKGGNGGRLRGPAQKEGQKVGMSKRMKATTAAHALSSGQTNGLASSLVFTPVQGLELVNPTAAADRVREANAKWFSDTSGFASARPK